MADGRLVKVGTVEDISDADADLLIDLGKAEPHTEAEPTPEAVIEAPKRRGRRRGAH